MSQIPPPSGQPPAVVHPSMLQTASPAPLTQDQTQAQQPAVAHHLTVSPSLIAPQPVPQAPVLMAPHPQPMMSPLVVPPVLGISPQLPSPPVSVPAVSPASVATPIGTQTPPPMASPALPVARPVVLGPPRAPAPVRPLPMVAPAHEPAPLIASPVARPPVLAPAPIQMPFRPPPIAPGSPTVGTPTTPGATTPTQTLAPALPQSLPAHVIAEVAAWFCNNQAPGTPPVTVQDMSNTISNLSMEKQKHMHLTFLTRRRAQQQAALQQQQGHPTSVSSTPTQQHVVHPSLLPNSTPASGASTPALPAPISTPSIPPAAPPAPVSAPTTVPLASPVAPAAVTPASTTAPAPAPATVSSSKAKPSAAASKPEAPAADAAAEKKDKAKDKDKSKDKDKDKSAADSTTAPPPAPAPPKKNRNRAKEAARRKAASEAAAAAKAAAAAEKAKVAAEEAANPPPPPDILRTATMAAHENAGDTGEGIDAARRNRNTREEGFRGTMRGEIARMMYACGDVQEPDVDTVDYLEDMCVEFLADFCRPIEPLRPTPNAPRSHVPLRTEVLRHRLASHSYLRKYLSRWDDMTYMAAELAASRNVAAPSHTQLIASVGKDFLGLDEQDAAAAGRVQGGKRRAAPTADEDAANKRKTRPTPKDPLERKKPGPKKGWKKNLDPNAAPKRRPGIARPFKKPTPGANRGSASAAPSSPAKTPAA